MPKDGNNAPNTDTSPFSFLDGGIGEIVGESLFVVVATRAFGEYALAYAEEKAGLYARIVGMKDNSFCWLIVGTTKEDASRLTKVLEKAVRSPPSLLQVLLRLINIIVLVGVGVPGFWLLLEYYARSGSL